MTRTTRNQISLDRHTLLALGVIFGALTLTIFGVSRLSSSQWFWSRPEIFPLLVTDKKELIGGEKLPLKVGQSFGWILLATSDAPIHWKEEYIVVSLPSENSVQVTLQDIRLTEKTEQPTKSEKVGEQYYGFVGNLWKIEERDLNGIHKFKIYVDQKLAKELNIEFYEEKP